MTDRAGRSDSRLRRFGFVLIGLKPAPVRWPFTWLARLGFFITDQTEA